MRTAASVVTPLQAIYDLVMWIYGILHGLIARDITITGESRQSNALTVLGIGYFSDLLTAGSDLNVTGKAKVGGQAALSSSLDVGGVATFRGDVDTSAGGGQTFLGKTTIYGALNCGADGRYAPKISTNHALSSTFSISPRTATRWYFTSVTPGASARIDDAGCVNGDELWIFNRTSVPFNVLRPDGVTLDTVRTGDGYMHGSIVVRDAGTWMKLTSIPFS